MVCTRYVDRCITYVRCYARPDVGLPHYGRFCRSNCRVCACACVCARNAPIARPDTTHYVCWAYCVESTFNTVTWYLCASDAISTNGSKARVRHRRYRVSCVRMHTAELDSNSPVPPLLLCCPRFFCSPSWARGHILILLFGTSVCCDACPTRPPRPWRRQVK